MELAQQFSQIFEGSKRAHGIFDINDYNNGQKQQGVARTIKTVGATLQNWTDHLEGKVGLGIIPINEDNLVKFL